MRVWDSGQAAIYSPVFLVYAYGENEDGHWTEVSFIATDKRRYTFVGADSIIIAPIFR